MNKKTIESVLRALLQVVGILTALNIGGDVVPVIGDLVSYLTSVLGQVFDAANVLVGVGLTLYGFFSDLKKPLTLSARWTERGVGEEVIKKAALKGLTAQEYLAKSA